ncbi:Sap-like sulfolipid-1-addressing protein [Branchiibius hedensis]|uniref:Sap, sulfolipid-1-addressing protein n=1 Tax=Branchiibius hedensis TaxID=672460 RepID=A0A2Y9C2E7_9MICO|nr:GAP family protein [Branchiibius hedensis]PWJ27152.1 Sap-like sulfolipid-1-addressing protein [Branchiibius hedensis]SSA35963.1 Sap, sulfolipid-1-addressing protein [Branchiibius hedensis]
MTMNDLGVLAALALADSMSVGTLLIPLWFLTAPGVLRGRALATYLATVATAYLVIGVVLVSGGRAVLDRAGGLISSTPVLLGQLALGVGLFAFGVGASSTPRGSSGRLREWRDRVTGEGARNSLMGLAIAAVVIEVATMLPYLIGTGLIARKASNLLVAVALVAAYCLVMILPAALATLARLAAHRQIAPALQRLDQWLTRSARETTLWIAALAGLFLAGSAAGELGWIGR